MSLVFFGNPFLGGNSGAYNCAVLSILSIFAYLYYGIFRKALLLSRIMAHVKSGKGAAIRLDGMGGYTEDLRRIRRNHLNQILRVKKSVVPSIIQEISIISSLCPSAPQVFFDNNPGIQSPTKTPNKISDNLTDSLSYKIFNNLPNNLPKGRDFRELNHCSHNEKKNIIHPPPPKFNFVEFNAQATAPFTVQIYFAVQIHALQQILNTKRIPSPTEAAPNSSGGPGFWRLLRRVVLGLDEARDGIGSMEMDRSRPSNSIVCPTASAVLTQGTFRHRTSQYHFEAGLQQTIRIPFNDTGLPTSSEEVGVVIVLTGTVSGGSKGVVGYSEVSIGRLLCDPPPSSLVAPPVSHLWGEEANAPNQRKQNQGNKNQKNQKNMKKNKKNKKNKNEKIENEENEESEENEKNENEKNEENEENEDEENEDEENEKKEVKMEGNIERRREEVCEEELSGNYGVYKMEITKQIVLCAGVPQEKYDIYGLEDTSEKECLICMFNLKEILLLPCRHCAICKDCLVFLRQEKCPICRAGFHSYITLPIHSDPTDLQHISSKSNSPIPL